MSCEGKNMQICATVTGGGGTPSYLWAVSGTLTPIGATNTNCLLIAAGGIGTAILTITGADCGDYTQDFEVNTLLPPLKNCSVTINSGINSILDTVTWEFIYMLNGVLMTLTGTTPFQSGLLPHLSTDEFTILDFNYVVNGVPKSGSYSIFCV